MRLFQNFQCPVFFKCIFLNEGSPLNLFIILSVCSFFRYGVKSQSNILTSIKNTCFSLSYLIISSASRLIDSKRFVTCWITHAFHLPQLVELLVYAYDSQFQHTHYLYFIVIEQILRGTFSFASSSFKIHF